MEFSPNELQHQILESLEALLKRNGDWHRALELMESGQYDETLHRLLQDAGFMDLTVTAGLGPLEAALVVEKIAERPGVVAAGATLLVYPMVTERSAHGPVALTTIKNPPSRMAPFATTVLVLADEEAMKVEVELKDIEVIDNDHSGWPLGRLKPEALARAVSLGRGTGKLLRGWWRVALALEAAGAMRGAVACTNQYIKDRVQFGHPLGSFQALQHRMAHLVVLTEGVYWLALRAAYEFTPINANAAATHAVASAAQVLRDTHQMQGAIGLSREYPLHLWTFRLPDLQRELGGLSGHSRELARAIATAHHG